MGIRGAILGDIAGSPFEFTMYKPAETDNYPLYRFDGSDTFTDDTVMSVATMIAIRENAKSPDFAKWYHKFGNLYPDAGYGGRFMEWLAEDKPGTPYGSYGNGSAMRCSYIGEYNARNTDIETVVRNAELSAVCTHDHPEGIKGAVVTAVCVWMAENGKSKDEIMQYAVSQYPSSEYKYGCDIPTEAYKHKMEYQISCQGSVPVAIRAFYDTDGFIPFMKLINSMQCDTDTLGAIGGAICESYYGNCFGSVEEDCSIIRKMITMGSGPTLDEFAGTRQSRMYQISCAMNNLLAESPKRVLFENAIKRRNARYNILEQLYKCHVLSPQTSKTERNR